MERTVDRLVRQLIFILTMSAFYSCTEPLMYESFVRQEARNEDGLYDFSIDLRDSLRSNTFYIYALIDAPEKAFSNMPEQLPLRMDFVSPTGGLYTETIVIPIDSFVISTRYSRQYESLYRSHFIPVEYGEWKLSVKVIGEDYFRGFRGIGFKHIKEEKDNGKR